MHVDAVGDVGSEGAEGSSRSRPSGRFGRCRLNVQLCLFSYPHHEEKADRGESKVKRHTQNRSDRQQVVLRACGGQ